MNWTPGAPFPMTPEATAQWVGRFDRAEQRLKDVLPSWEAALARYTKSKAANYDVNALKDFRHVETKKAALFFDTPHVRLPPKDYIAPELAAQVMPLLPLRETVLNHYLGPEGTAIKGHMLAALFDCLAPSGWLVTEIGYDVRTVEARDELGQVILDETGTPMPVPFWSHPYWVRVSPRKLLVPDDWTSTQFDEAPWLALRGVVPLKTAKAMGWTLPEAFTPTTQGDPYLLTGEAKREATSDGKVQYTKVWYRAALYDDDVLHPDLYRSAIFVEGVNDRPVKTQNSPFQSLLPNGSLSPTSMKGNPIHVGALRQLTDSAYVSSDLVMMEQLSHEVNKFRTTQTRARVANMAITVIDPQTIPADEVEKLKQGEKVIFCNPGALMNGGAPSIIGVATPGQQPRDNYTAQDYIERDIEGAMGMGANQVGASNSKSTTATEVRTVQTNAGARAEQEKNLFREFFVSGVRKFDAVLQTVLEPTELQMVLGPQGAALWAQWQQLPGCYVYKILPDDGVHQDQAQYRAGKIDEYNLLRKDPQVNATELLKAVTRSLGYDPDKVVVQTPPEPGPEPARLSLAFKGEDLVGPQSQAVVEILAQAGYTISPGAIETLKAGSVLQGMTNTIDALPAESLHQRGAHGGSADATEPVNKHSSERTGGLQSQGVM